MPDFLFRGDLAALDPAVAELIAHEAERQVRKLILIPSESQAPLAVLEALGSVLQNIYAEGYPDPATRRQREEEILDYARQLAEYRRYADPRYYKGVEYADVIEALARRRAAEAFATAALPADKLYINAQALSGAPANNAVYHALLTPGDTVMGLSLVHGGHLTHGSPVNRSGKYYKIVSYTVDPDTERIDYDAVAALAREQRPRMIIAGYSSYPWLPDWRRFRAIADEVGAYLLADVAHIAGMIAAGVLESPVGIADVVTFTTHKSLCGPRGACILTGSAELSRKLDRAVFPGEQGGPHMNAIAGIAVAMKLARTPEFKALQAQTVANARRLADELARHGLRIAFGGTDTHLVNIDCKSVKAKDGTPLMGDVAARILDVADIVVNRNTIPGDSGAGLPSGLRLGTPWVTQRGFREPEIARLAEIIAGTLKACTPFTYDAKNGDAYRAKIDWGALVKARRGAADLAAAAATDVRYTAHGYPFYPADAAPGLAQITVAGAGATEFLQYATASNVLALADGATQPTALYAPNGAQLAAGTLRRENAERYVLALPPGAAGPVATWLRDLSDGYVSFDEVDVYAKLPGPLVISAAAGPAPASPKGAPAAGQFAPDAHKPYFIGHRHAGASSEPALPLFAWTEKEGPLQRTSLFETHKQLGARMVPFAGWEMPVWYSSVVEEHRAVRTVAGLFDVSHMGVFEMTGPQAEHFLDLLTANDVHGLKAGMAHYSYLLNADGTVIDDIFIYRLGAERFMMVVNASNNDKDWAWINAVHAGTVQIDPARPWARVQAQARIRDLRAPSSGAERRVDLAIQGPRSRDVLMLLADDEKGRARLKNLPWTGVFETRVGGHDVVIARTGYTGERVAFEVFVNPDEAPALWMQMLDAAKGAGIGLLPIGLGARDSLRTEGGLPLYGHELAGPLGLNPADAGFPSYVKTYKPFFAGRGAYLAHEAVRKSEVVRFRMAEKGLRTPKQLDLIVDKRGKVIGKVTSAAVDTDGYMLGLAYVESAYAVAGTPVGVLQAEVKRPDKPRNALGVGERAVIPEAAVVLSRFPAKK
jgi:glycine hydroxymethyltransferase